MVRMRLYANVCARRLDSGDQAVTFAEKSGKTSLGPAQCLTDYGQTNAPEQLTGSNLREDMPLEDKSDAEILNIVNPIMDNLMDASTRIDHARHTRDFSDRIKAIVTKEHLETVCKKYQAEKGLFAERKFVCLIRRPGAVAVIWSQRFTKVPGEFVAELLLVERGSEYLVEHVMVW